jgi:hypothetical protein
MLKDTLKDRGHEPQVQKSYNDKTEHPQENPSHINHPCLVPLPFLVLEVFNGNCEVCTANKKASINKRPNNLMHISSKFLFSVCFKYIYSHFFYKFKYIEFIYFFDK